MIVLSVKLQMKLQIKNKMKTNAVPIDLSEAEYRADNLVTCKEFMNALKTETTARPAGRRNIPT